MLLKAYKTHMNPQTDMYEYVKIRTRGMDTGCRTHQCCGKLSSSHISLNWETYTLLGSRALDLLDLPQQELQSKLLFWVFLHSRQL